MEDSVGKSTEPEMGLSGYRDSAGETVCDKDIFILSGQSNMAGRGGVTHHKKWDHVVPPECLPDPSILRFSAKLRWEEAREPLHADIDSRKTCGIGPGMPFARGVLGRCGGTVGLVPCAVGGTQIAEWERGRHLYEEMVRRARASREEGGRIRALLWYQGESDTLSKQAAETYKGNMERLIRDARSDLGLPDLPIIQVALASGEERWREVVREAQLKMDVHNVVCVDAMGLELRDDHLHLTTKAQVELGRMLADAYLDNFAG
ncbi:probable carbohydrate esterase At4g34215 [Aristolochia californica]|uniref:probable carbohydrate esterase At4g34215 n=1 Tax=Aristolochia californica TaxID=171875 RepID=UPI0035E0D78E